MVCAVNPFCNLVQAGTDPPKLCVVLPEETVIHIIYISIENELPEESRFAFHAGQSELFIKNILFPVIQTNFIAFSACPVCHF